MDFRKICALLIVFAVALVTTVVFRPRPLKSATPAQTETSVSARMSKPDPTTKDLAPVLTPAASVARGIPDAKSDFPVAVLLEKQPAIGCFTLSFHHKSAPGHADRRACATHSNTVELPRKNYNKKSVCVRLDGTPVRFESEGARLIVGPQAGPESVITVRYCTGTFTCREECAIPKDPFMDALAGDEAVRVRVSRAGWSAADSEVELDIEKDMDLEIAGIVKNADKPANFSQWSAGQEAVACRTNVASVGKRGF